MGQRDVKPSIGDRIPFVFIENPDKKALQGERIETPDFIKANNLKINYGHYITNQIMKPVQQVFALVLEKMSAFKKRKGHTLRVWKDELKKLKDEYPDEIQYQKKEQMLRNKEVKILLFDEFLRITNNSKNNNQSIESFFKPKGTPKVK